jgi:hypothetical protein
MLYRRKSFSYESGEMISFFILRNSPPAKGTWPMR